MGGSISEHTLPRLKCAVIAGSANNQVAGAKVPGAILERGILYAPDYVINAGGLINVYVELHGYDRTRALALTREIYSRLREVFTVAHDLGIPTSVAADRIVEQRLAQGRRERITDDALDVDASGHVATSIAEVVAQGH
jgi:leucine dehydrogenase